MPNGLQSLRLSRSYGCSLKNVTFPAGLDTLELGDRCDGDLPPGLQTSIFCLFVHLPLDILSLPSFVQSLTTGHLLNGKLKSLPSSLVTLTLCFAVTEVS